jgi:hypothetical protein
MRKDPPDLRLVPHTLPDSALADLARSGITPADAHAHGLRYAPDAHALHPMFAPAPALVIPYDKLGEGDDDEDDYTGAFYRIRYLGDPPKSFKTKPLAKYSQPPDSGVRAYFPRCQPWRGIIERIEEPIIITEGEKKAIAACLRDFPCIGLGGVYSFKTKDTEFLPELEAINWQDRSVYIAYDSDAAQKPQVAMATDRLAQLLRTRGARVRVMRLPSPRGENVGLDDYLLTHTNEEFVQLSEEADEGYPPEFLRLNEEVVYVADLDRVADLKTDRLMTVQAFMNSSRFASRTYRTPVRGPNGAMVFREMPAAQAWMRWPNRHEVDRLTYQPGEPRITDKGLNQWRGWGCDSVAGDVTPWLDFTAHLWQSLTRAQAEWLHSWHAYQVQHPGVKLEQAIVYFSTEQGVGKTLAAKSFGMIFGKANMSVINSTELHSAFNEWQRAKQLIVGEEITNGNKKNENERIKTMITETDAYINIKGVPLITIEDCANYIFTTNHANAFYIEAKDRRMFIVDVPDEAKRSRDIYTAFVAWRDNGGLSHMRHFYETYPISPDYAPHTAPPRTTAHKVMTIEGSSDVGRWCLELKAYPAGKLVVGRLKHQRDLFTSRDMLDIYRQEGNDPNRHVTINGMSTALKAAGFKHVYGGNAIQANGRLDRYFAIRNAKKWLNPPPRVKVSAWLRANIELKPI